MCESSLFVYCFQLGIRGGPLCAKLFVPVRISGCPIYECEHAVDWILLLGRLVTFDFHQLNLQTVKQPKKSLIQLCITQRQPFLGVIVMRFKTEPPVGQADDVLRVRIHGHQCVGVGQFGKCPEQGLQFQFRGRRVGEFTHDDARVERGRGACQFMLRERKGGAVSNSRLRVYATIGKNETSAHTLCGLGQQVATGATTEDHQPGGCFEAAQGEEGEDREEDVWPALDAVRPDGVNECREEQADDGCIGAGETRLRPCLVAELIPQGQ